MKYLFVVNIFWGDPEGRNYYYE